MNILNNKNKRTSIFKALALCLFAAVSFTFVSCDDDMDIQQSYPFTVETMPVPNKVTKGQTVEIRCELKKTGDFANPPCPGGRRGHCRCAGGLYRRLCRYGLHHL